MAIETKDSIYFYRERDAFGYLSNFYKSPFVSDGVKYWCMEQYIMKKKQEMFDPHNIDAAKSIMTSKSANAIKAMGRGIQNFNDEIWREHRECIAYDGIMCKFQQNESLLRQLLSTGSKRLYEATKNDKIWAIGFDPEDAVGINPNRYGLNILGKALMRVRDELCIDSTYPHSDLDDKF